MLELQACVSPGLPVSSLKQGCKFTVGKCSEKGLKGDGEGGDGKVFWKGGKVCLISGQQQGTRAL